MSSLDLLLRMPQFDHAISGMLTLLAICSVRLAMVVLLFPPTDSSVLQPMIKTGVVMIFSTYVAYGQPASLIDSLHGPALLALGVREAVIGLVIGMAASSVFWTAQGAGAYVDDLTGYNNVQMSNPTQGQQTTLTSTLLSQFAIAAFWLLGGMPFVLGAVYESFRWWPLGNLAPIPGAVLEAFVLHKTDSLMETVAKLASPMMMMLLLVDVGFAFTGKTSQKLNLNTLGQPVKGALTLLMLALMAGLFIEQVREQLVLSDFAAEARSLANGK